MHKEVAIFTFVGKINALDFHRTADLLVTTGEDDSNHLYGYDLDIATIYAKFSFVYSSTTHHKKHGADRICFTHHPSSVICSSTRNIDSGGEALRYLSMYDDNRCLGYFKGHKDRLAFYQLDVLQAHVGLEIYIVDEGILHLRGRPTVAAYDQQGRLVFARCGFSVDASPNTTIEATFTPDGQYVVSGSGDGTLNAWSISKV
ncbi:putative transcription factor WD40-like family [Helianthus annuus]|uniref:Transcription factor WD40-like family n=1 Tax=Helianthus annuus TaxID=4232 RepID=A0A9K3DMX5_HELAN|nr:putative transcription factor WD40-like family [Helianthus annuus]